MKHYLLRIVAITLFATSLNAQIPVLNVNGKKSNSEVYLQSLDIQVEVTGNIASTKYLMVFKNRTSKILEGELIFPLADGITINHYALDINGKMRNAVPVEKAKATQVFEEIEQRRIDPGILEKVEGNNFRVRIFPIPSNGTRTISIGYEEELSAEKGLLHYRLPMDYKEIIENFSLKASVWQSHAKPSLSEKPSDEINFDRQGNNFVATFSRKNYVANRSLAFSLPAPSDIPQVLMQSASGSYYFVAACMPKLETRKKEWNSEIGIIWDASLSGLSRDVKKELELLDIIIKDKKNLTISLYLLNNKFTNAGTFNIKNGNWDNLRKALESTVYDGGTNYGTIKLSNTHAKEFLFFTDGISTLSDAVPFIKSPIFSKAMQMLKIQETYNGKMIHCIVSSPKANYSNLKYITAQTKGKFINLNSLSSEKMKNELLYEDINFLGVENAGSVREVYPSVSTSVKNNFSIAGILDAPKSSITLLFGYGNKIEKRITLNLDSKNAISQANVYRIWAQKKIDELDMNYEKNKEELTELGMQFGIVTRNTSLIVLETLQDYITYNIVPPEELQEEFYRWRKNRDDEQRRTEQNLLAQAIFAAKNLKEWWEKDFTPKKSKYPKPDDKILPDTDIINDNIELTMPTEDVIFEREESSPRYENKDILESVAFSSDSNISRSELKKEISATDKSKPNQTQPKIKLMPIRQDADYMKDLKGKSDDDYAMYLKLRENYINTPNFYFDMADWFYKLNDKDKALLILTSIADIDLENASLFRLLGYRFKEYKEYELETYICNKIIEWRPMEPQSYRDYALALADKGQYREALKSLYSVLTQSYSQNTNNRISGLEEVVVTELNSLIAKNDKPDISEIDKNLIQAMPVDIRVVINWNMNNTDIDLHVKDPNGETCFYSHKSTDIGGRISNDITQGYGPEQFMLKKAVKGKYEVFVNYFGDSQVKAEGPSTIMVEIYTKYSDSDEQRQVVCVQLSKNKSTTKNGLLKIAEFEF
ncbi:MAG: DUF2135 domain-containing protein [Prevotellaceae bacterium]|jgi:hypothetical protein|nr:DUF2135 domain-containing protein [Prevotellaceae bacterium]